MLFRSGFQRWDILRIFAEPYANNVGSRRVLEKAGFRLEGLLRKSVFKAGRSMDSCVYGLLREELPVEKLNDLWIIGERHV